MDALKLIRASPKEDSHTPKNPLPDLLRTPSGLALLEMQGTINLPSHDDKDTISAESHVGLKSQQTPIGRLIFPDYNEADTGSTAWMKRVYLYVGKHQRLTGEVKKLPKAMAIIRKVKGEDEHMEGDNSEEQGEGIGVLEVVEIIKYRILFSTRPEPVGTWAAAD